MITNRSRRFKNNMFIIWFPLTRGIIKFNVLQKEIYLRNITYKLKIQNIIK